LSLVGQFSLFSLSFYISLCVAIFFHCKTFVSFSFFLFVLSFVRVATCFYMLSFSVCVFVLLLSLCSFVCLSCHLFLHALFFSVCVLCSISFYLFVGVFALPPVFKCSLFYFCVSYLFLSVVFVFVHRETFV
jgi:hypothetical protein